MTTSRIEELDAQIVTFAAEHGFLGVRPERYKKCSIFVFRIKGDREADYQSFTSFMMTKYSIPGVLPDIALVMANIYVYKYGKATQWAIPNANASIIEEIRKNKPSWVFERLK